MTRPAASSPAHSSNMACSSPKAERSVKTVIKSVVRDVLPTLLTSQKASSSCELKSERGAVSKSLLMRLPTVVWKPKTTSMRNSIFHMVDQVAEQCDTMLQLANTIVASAAKIGHGISEGVAFKLEAHPISLKRERASAAESQGEEEPLLKGLSMCEDEDMHRLWERGLRGRSPDQLKPNQLQCLLEQNAPLKYRHQLWQHWLAGMLVGDVEQLQTRVPEDAARQIDLDVPRTQVSCLSEYDQNSLRRVLRAYAAWNPSIGYCQGMNSMAAVFVVLGFDETTAFGGLRSLTKECCPEYFGPSLEGYIRDVAVLGVLVRKLFPPQFLRRLNRLELPLHILAADHFLTLGSRTWPLGGVVRLWDLFFLEGSPAVFASFLVLLELYLPEDAPRGMDAAQEVECFLKAVASGISNDVDRILKRTRELIPRIPRSKLEGFRCIYSGTACGA